MEIPKQEISLNLKPNNARNFVVKIDDWSLESGLV